MKSLPPGKLLSRDLLLVSIGAVAQQLLGFLLLPLITRQFSAEAYGHYAYALALVQISSVVSAVGFDRAILTAGSDADIGVLYAAIVGGAMLGAPLVIISTISVIAFPSRVYVPIVAIWHLSATVVLAELVARQTTRRYASAVTIQLCTVGGSLLAGAVLGAAGWNSAICLIAAQTGVNAVFAGWSLLSNRRVLLEILHDPTKLKETLSRYSDFPKYVLPSTAITFGVAQMPVLVIGTAFGAAFAGAYQLGIQLLSAPATILGRIAQQYLTRHMTDEIRREAQCLRTFTKCLLILGCVSIIGYSFVGFYAKGLVAVWFGSKWTETGNIVQRLSLFYIPSVVAGPLSVVFLAARKNEVNLGWQIGYAIVAVLFFFVFVSLRLFSWPTLISIWGGLLMCVYLVYILLEWRAAARPGATAHNEKTIIPTT